MKFTIFRKNCLINLFILALFFFLFVISFVNFFDKNAEIIPSVIGTIGLFAFLSFWLWMILRNYLQVIMFNKDGIYTHKGFKKYLHFKYEDIVKIKIVSFDCPPKFRKGATIRGVDSIMPAPQITPKKWILISDGRENDNVSNYNSYLVPIREHMVIKFEYSEKRIKSISKLFNCEVEYQTISFEEMKKHTPQSKTL